MRLRRAGGRGPEGGEHGRAGPAAPSAPEERRAGPYVANRRLCTRAGSRMKHAFTPPTVMQPEMAALYVTTKLDPLAHVGDKASPCQERVGIPT